MDNSHKPISCEDIIERERARGLLVQCRACKGEGFIDTDTLCPACAGTGDILRKAIEVGSVYVLTDRAMLWIGVVFLGLAAIGGYALLHWAVQ